MMLGSALRFLGQIDGAIAAGAAAFAMYDPSAQKAALLTAGIAGAAGVILNLIAKFAGLGPVAPTNGSPPAS